MKERQTVVEKNTENRENFLSFASVTVRLGRLTVEDKEEKKGKIEEKP